MKNIRIKIKKIYLPFLVVSVATILSYNLFRWVFDIKLSAIPLKEDVLNLWIPFLLPWITASIWLRRRVRILNIGGSTGNGYFGYILSISFAIAAPILLSQNYIEKASFELVSFPNTSEIENHKSEKYLHIESFEIIRNSSLPYVTVRSSGRHNERLVFYLYLACPFKDADNIWYGVEYNKIISNRMSDNKKNFEYQKFLEESQKDFDTYNFQKVNYFMKLRYSDERDGFIRAIVKKYPEISASNQTILIPKNEVFEKRLGDSLSKSFWSFGIGSFIILIMIVIPKIDEKELSNFNDGNPLKNDDLKYLLSLLNPMGSNKETAILLLMNISVFVVMIFLGYNILYPTTQELLEIGGNRRNEVLSGDYWRLFTSIFIHGGIIHLAMNFFGLVLGASFLQGLLERFQLTFSFLFCGFIASISSIYWHENTVSVGASGAIFGLYGIILAFSVFKIYPKLMLRVIWMLLVFYAGVNLLFGFIASGIDNAAHIGGLLSGFVLGSILIVISKEKLKYKARK